MTRLLSRIMAPLSFAGVVPLAALAMWAGFFAYLWITGAVIQFLGPRTQWVVVFGAIVLSLCILLVVAGPRRSHTETTRADRIGFLIMIVPILALLAVPHASLGSAAAAQKGIGPGGAFSAAPAPRSQGPPTFIDIHYASRSPSYAARAGIAAGDPVKLVGFVTHHQQVGDFSLTRFYVYCCLADAIPYSVDVIAGEHSHLSDNTWVAVRGKLVRDHGSLAVQTTDIERVPKPDPPYLY